VPLAPLPPTPRVSVSNRSPVLITPLHNEPLLIQKFSLFDDESAGITSESSFHSDSWFITFEELVLPLLEERQDGSLDVTEIPGKRRVRIAILDTGFDRKDLAILANVERIKGMRSWVDGGKADEDIIGHGTHTIALLLKMAPEADIFVARVAKYNHLENADSSHIAEAIMWATTDCEVDIITMSFGFPRRIELIQSAIKAAHSQDVIMFAATSNSGGNHGIAYPANQFSRVICINSTDGQGNSSKFSPNPHPQNENFATLGEAVNSSWPSALDVNCTRRKSGTSFATPIAAGIAAVVLEYAMQKLPVDKYAVTGRLRSCEGMKAVLKLMAEVRNGYRYIKPWKLFSPEYSYSYIRETILEELRKV